MKLAFSTNAYTKHPLTDALRGIKAAGFQGVEILADVPNYTNTKPIIQISEIAL